MVPIKPLATAKSRLRRAAGAAADGLALAFALDTVAAALSSTAVHEVLVVTDDAVAARTLRGLGARAVPDEPRAGLNPAVRHGAALLGPGRPVAALAADLPALRPAELTAALDAATAAGRRCFVPDVLGTGTVLLAAPPGVDLDPRFGDGSAAAHAASGALRLAGEWPALRRDVDTVPDLAAAFRLGLGRRTAAALGR